MRAAAGRGQGVAVGATVASDVAVAAGVAFVSNAPDAERGVGLGGGAEVTMAGGGTVGARSPAAASGAAMVGKIGVGSAGSARAWSGSGKRIA